MKKFQFNGGFTLIELVLITGVLTIVFASTRVVFANIIGKNSLNHHGHQLVQNLREARMKAVSQKNDSAWGLRFEDATAPHGYTFFKGASYATRDSAFDLDFEFPTIVTISQLSFGGGDEVVFSKSSGNAASTGSIDLVADGDTYVISVNSLGFVDYIF